MRYIEKYGAYFEIVNGQLYDAPAVAIKNKIWDRCEVIPDLDNYGKVTAPQAMGELATDFLKDINEIFGTNYTLDQFDGR